MELVWHGMSSGETTGTIGPGTSRREPDLSGCMESLADACEGLLWVDDKQIISWDGARKVHDKRNPRVEFSYQIRVA